MKKTLLIIKREYLTRVRKKYFIILTILGPILFAALMIVPTYLATLEEKDAKEIAVVDDSGFYKGHLKSNQYVQYIFTDETAEQLKENIGNSQYYAILHIFKTDSTMPKKASLYSKKQITMSIKSRVEDAMSEMIESQILLDVHQIKKTDLSAIKSQSNVDIQTIQVNDDGTEKVSYTDLNWAVGMFLAIVIYFFIFFFGSQVMRSVIEEKVNRIVEIIVSSVKPFQLMAGKIIGVALVGLTQIVLWVLLTFVLVNVFQLAFPEMMSMPSNQMVDSNQLIPDANSMAETQNILTDSFKKVQSINFPLVIGTFIFFFLGGYILYGALFAAIGAAVDNEADTQSFVLPITAPLIISIFVIQYIINNPDSPVAFWFSVVPFTSPIVMIMRVAMGVPNFDLILSMVLLVLGCIGTIWLAAKIYRTGILMYGKKANYKELWKWLFYRG